MANFKRRVIGGVGANGYGQIIAIVTQLVSVPVFLSQWNVPTYGKWLLLVAIPSYVAMSDFGIVTVAKNRMTILMGDGKISDAQAVFHSAQKFVYSVCGVVVVLVLIFVTLPIPLLESTDYRFALAFLICGVLVGQIGGLAEAVFMATSRFPMGSFQSANARLGEWTGYMAGLYLFGSFSGVAFSGLLLKSCVVVFSIVFSTRGRNDFTWGIKLSRREIVGSLIRPAFSFMTFTMSNAVTFQGLTIIAGIVLGPSAVVLFNTYRTLSRLAVQVTATIGHALWPEFSRIFGSQGSAGLRLIYKRTSYGTAVGAWGLSVVLYFSGQELLSVWTHGAVQFDPLVLAVFLLYAAIAGTVHTPRTLLMATNSHITLGPFSLLVSLITVVSGWFLAHTYGVFGMVISMIVGEGLLLIFCLVSIRVFFKSNKSGSESLL